jgi:electron-transferring-flavoprotein dehydrogenase
MFFLFSSRLFSGVRHNEDQPSHLRVRPNKAASPLKSFNEYAGPEGRFCPAKVYEYLTDDNGNTRLQINNTNCVHCKTCAIKTTDQFIDWTVPEGGGGPN